MRACNRLLLYTFLAAPIALSSCSKEVKAEFPRPPVTASTPAVEVEPPSLPEAESLSSEPVVAEEMDLEPVVETPSPKATVEPSLSRPAPTVPAKPPTLDAEERPSTQLSGSDPVDPEVLAKLRQAISLLGSVQGRKLSNEQHEQVTAARSFVTQARQASAEGDERRALVLIDKAVILAEDVESSSRR